MKYFRNQTNDWAVYTNGEIEIWPLTNQNRNGITADYHCSIVVSANCKTVFACINQINSWWTENFYGNSASLGDQWSIRYGKTFVNAQVVELIPGRSIVWLITDCYLHWQENKTEWKNTKLQWRLTEENGSTKISFTHAGLAPEFECYEHCRKGWDQYVKGSLPLFINYGKGEPEKLVQLK